jgi:adenosylcobinamide-GDP ribazoletransferase
LIGALSFFTIVGRGRVPAPGDVRWFPVAGLLVGAVVGGAWWGAGELWPPAVAAAIVVALDLAVTGMLHLDGLADSADGLLPHMERARRLEVMRQPDVGAFGVGAVVALLLLRFAALASMAPDVGVIAGLWCASRTVMAVGLTALPYARSEGGLASAFGGGRGAWAPVLVVGAAAALAAAVAGEQAQGAVTVAVAALGGAAVLAVGRARLGGYTGDVLGAAGLVAETVGLLAASAAW